MIDAIKADLEKGFLIGCAFVLMAGIGVAASALVYWLCH